MNGIVDQEALIASVQARLDAMTVEMEAIRTRLAELDVIAEERILKVKVNRGLRQQMYNVTSKAEIMQMVKDAVEQVIQRRLDTDAMYTRIERLVLDHAEKNWRYAIVNAVANRITDRMMLVERPTEDGKPE